jgi:tRNA 2-thiouridine synthesizing protein A
MAEIEKLNVSDKICPIPVLMAKKRLEKMRSGQLLEITGNTPPARDNIQRMAKSWGHEVIEVKEERGEFRIILRKK